MRTDSIAAPYATSYAERYRNCILLAGLDTIPVRTVNLSDTEVLEIQ